MIATFRMQRPTDRHVGLIGSMPVVGRLESQLTHNGGVLDRQVPAIGQHAQSQHRARILHSGFSMVAGG
jgi:hypothetical protein